MADIKIGPCGHSTEQKVVQPTKKGDVTFCGACVQNILTNDVAEAAKKTSKGEEK
jgi:hypothetical protein